MRARFKKGKKITSPTIVFQLLVDGENIYWNDKCQNASWLRSMQFHTLLMATKRGILSYAIRVDEPMTKKDGK